MPNISYTAVFEQAADGTWSGYVPDLPVILATGATKAEAVTDMRTAMSLWIEDRKQRGLPIPSPATEFVHIEVAA